MQFLTHLFILNNNVFLPKLVLPYRILFRVIISNKQEARKVKYRNNVCVIYVS